MLMDINKTSSLGLGNCTNSCCLKKNTPYISKQENSTVLLFQPFFQIQRNRKPEHLNPVHVFVPPSPLVQHATASYFSIIHTKRAPCKHMKDDTESLNRLFSLSLARLPPHQNVQLLSFHCVHFTSIFFSICNCNGHT